MMVKSYKLKYTGLHLSNGSTGTVQCPNSLLFIVVVLTIIRHDSGGQHPAFQQGGPGIIPDLLTYDILPTK